jgi:ribosome recycling factor
MSASPSGERRVNRGLREVLDELVEHVRYVARNVQRMSKQDLEYAEERLEWLADEVWRAATEIQNPKP